MPSATGPVTRFAPSPTGYLHLGHAAAALNAWRRARAAGGRFLLRIEDIDPVRCRADYTEALAEDLAWLGIDWDGEVLRQSARLPLYAASLAVLERRGLLYPCFCSRADIRREVAASASAPHGPDGAPLYPGTCRSLPPADRTARIAAGAPHAWRLNMGAALAGAPPLWFRDEHRGEVRAAPERFGDVVLGRRDAPASYHLCVTHDDAAQGVTLVTRGDDLLWATDLHRLLQHVFGWPVPAYAHHPLLRDAGGQKLSKRDGAATLRALREAGVSAAAVIALADRAGSAA
jgi:glutamyl-Q tRNA(Asp) synthetase